MIDLTITDVANLRHAEMLRNAEEYRNQHPIAHPVHDAKHAWRIDLGKLHINVWFGGGYTPVAQV